jgi:hypothetical protein
MSTPTSKLFSEIREAARRDRESLRLQKDLEGDEAPTEEEFATMQMLERTLELTVLAVDNSLDE